jgi:hypothetical protein
MPKLYINFEEILLCAHGNSDKQNKVLESSIIIINYCIIIIINAYYNYIINAKYNYYNSNIGLLKEYNKKENVELNGATTTSCLKRRL